MRVVVTSAGAGLDAQVSPIFGRCNTFVFVDTDTMEATSVPNAATSAPGGAGIQSAQFIVREGAEAVLSGNLGPNAMQVLSASGVAFYSVTGGTVREAVEALLAGRLQQYGAPTVPSDFGKGSAGMGTGRGRGGGGRGMGLGRGRGQGA